MKGINGMNGFFAEYSSNIYISKAVPMLGYDDVQMIEIDAFGIVWGMRAARTLVYSLDYGLTWVSFGSQGNNGHYSISFAPDGRLFTTNVITKYLWIGTITRNSNNVPTSISWESKSIVSLGETTWFDCAFTIDSKLMITGYNGVLAISSDYGTTFDSTEQISTYLRIIGVNSLGHIYTIGVTDLYVSKDNGATFSVINSFPLNAERYINGIAFDDEDNIYLSEFSPTIYNDKCKIYKSSDGGYSFAQSAYIDYNSALQDYYGLAAYGVGKIVLTSRSYGAFQATFSDEMGLEIVDKTLDNAEIVCTMNKGNDAFLPNFGLTPTRFMETQLSASVVRKEITTELAKDGFTDISVNLDVTGEILIDCKNDK
jgi:hypothetical protein